MIYVLTAIHRSTVFAEVQRDALRRWLPEPYRVHATVSGLRRPQLRWLGEVGGIDLTLPGSTDRRGQYAHAANLNTLAADVCQSAADTDLLIFLDSDAWPIGPVLPLVEGMYSVGYSLVAVRRAENLGEPQPHPLFCAITAGMWREIVGDWRPGYRWTNTRGESWTDTGANMIPALAGRPWCELLRANTVNPHPVFFGVYGVGANHVVYHHGATSRVRICRADRAETGKDREAIRERAAANEVLGDEIRQAIDRDPVGFWRRFLP